MVELNEDVQDSYNSHSHDVIRDVPLRDIRNITYGHHAAAVTQLLESQYSVAHAAWFASSQFAGSGRWLTSPVGMIQPPNPRSAGQRVPCGPAHAAVAGPQCSS
jgi:hypothetical protein